MDLHGGARWCGGGLTLEHLHFVYHAQVVGEHGEKHKVRGLTPHPVQCGWCLRLTSSGTHTLDSFRIEPQDISFVSQPAAYSLPTCAAMDLTPVKIRGKRKRPGATQSNLQKALTVSLSQIKQPRPFRSIQPKKITAMVIPTLQGLPQELLEIIFLYSMNIALPRSSPILGRRLSARTVTLEFVLRAFFHTVDHKTNYRDRKTSGDPVLQSQLLACRFFTWAFFRSYVHKAHTTLVQERGAIWKASSVQPPGLEAFDGLLPFKFMKITYLGFADGFHVPDKLLHGPWSPDKASLLYVLVSLSGELDWTGSMAGEVARDGIVQAIDENAERTVAALAVLLGVAQMIDTSLLRKAVMNHRCNFNIVRQLLFNAQILQQGSPRDSLDFYGEWLTWFEESKD